MKLGSQIDLEGKTIVEHEDWVVQSPQIDELTERVHTILGQIPEFDFIEKTDVQVVVAKKSKRARKAEEDPAKVIHTFAMCMPVRPEIRAVAQGQNAILAPYLVVVYPAFFEVDAIRQAKIIIHELKHVPRSKKGTVPHWGFGDTEVDMLFRKHLNDQKSL